MFVRTLRISLVFAWFLGTVSGCSAVPPAPVNPAVRPEGSAPKNDGYAEEDGDGWLFDRLMGRKSASDTPPASSPPVAASGQESQAPNPVQQASAVLPAVESELEEVEKPGFSLEDLSPENVYKNTKVMLGYGPDENIAKAAFQEGEALYAQKKYTEAAAKFKTAASRWPDSPLEEDALFYLGECYFFTDQYPKAQDTFGQLLKKYDNSRYLDTVASRQFNIGRFWEEQYNEHPAWPVVPNLTDKTRPWFDTFGNAIKAYEFVQMYDPTGPLADDSVMAVGNAYFLKGRYEDAAFEYDKLRKDYPKSSHQLNAHLLAMKAKREIYQGEFYDATPLEETGKIADQLLNQFPDQLGPEKSRVLQTRNEVDQQKAARDLAVAQYYEKRKQYGAARYYYRAMLKEYPNTEPARVAQARLEAIKGKPDKPPERFGWLVDLFSTKD